MLNEAPTDAKIFEGDIPDQNAIPDNSDNNNDWTKAFEFISNNGNIQYDELNKIITLLILL